MYSPVAAFSWRSNTYIESRLDYRSQAAVTCIKMTAKYLQTCAQPSYAIRHLCFLFKGARELNTWSAAGCYVMYGSCDILLSSPSMSFPTRGAMFSVLWREVTKFCFYWKLEYITRNKHDASARTTGKYILKFFKSIKILEITLSSELKWGLKLTFDLSLKFTLWNLKRSVIKTFIIIYYLQWTFNALRQPKNSHYYRSCDGTVVVFLLIWFLL